MSRTCGAVVLCAWLITGCATTSTGTAGITVPAAARTEPEKYLLVTVANPTAAWPTRAGSTLRGYDTTTGYRVSTHARTLAEAIARDYGLRPAEAWPIVTLRVHCVLYEVSASQSREAVLSRLAADPRVELAQPLQTFTTAAGSYNDPYLSLQRSFRDMSLAAAHEWSEGDGATVAIIDTGVDVSHPDLAGRVRGTRNFVDRDQARFEQDRHGTAVAGIIAAVGNNGLGIVGVAPQVELQAYKACWQQADGAAACNSFTLALALEAAIRAGVDVINLSLVGPDDPLLAELVRRATLGGIVVVGAMPESGQLDGFPAGAPNVFAVDMAERLASASSVLRAPGREVLTLTPEGHYDFQSGSSLAVAGVSGIVALLRSRNANLSVVTIRDVLDRSTRDVRSTSGPVGRSINACLAVSAVVPNAHCRETGTPKPSLAVVRD